MRALSAAEAQERTVMTVDDDRFGRSDAGTSQDSFQCRNSGRIEKRSGQDTARGSEVAVLAGPAPLPSTCSHRRRPSREE